jgi:hypothetical protein
MLTIKSSETEISALRYEMYHYPDALVQKRLHSVYLKATQPKLNCSQIGSYVSLHRRTISACIHTYNTFGIEGLKYNNYGTNISELAKNETTIIQPHRRSESNRQSTMLFSSSQRANMEE